MCTPIVHAAYWEYNIAPLLPEKLARVQLLVADIFTVKQACLTKQASAKEFSIYGMLLGSVLVVLATKINIY